MSDGFSSCSNNIIKVLTRSMMLESLEAQVAAQPLAIAVLVMVFGYFAWDHGPPVAVVVRTIRPQSVVMGGTAWIFYRLLLLSIVGSSSSSSKSLLALLVDILDRIEHAASELVVLPTLLQRVTIIFYTLWEDLLVILMVASAYRLLYCLYHYTFTEWKDMAIHRIYVWAKEHVPVVRREIQKECIKVKKDINKIIHKDPSSSTAITRLPTQGQSHKEIIQLLTARAESDHASWKAGKVSGTVYTTQDKDHAELIEAVYSAYALSNPLHPDVWPSLRQMDAEIVAMTASILRGEETTSDKGESINGHGPLNTHSSVHDIVGTTTSGGTESIILAIKAHRAYFGKRRSIAYPELICGSTAHASVDKACDMMNIRKVCIPCDAVTHTMVPSEIEKYVTSNTIMIFASAPCYSQGTIDPIEELSNIAQKYDIGLHVDACLGGWVLPFARKLGYTLPAFGFELPGVTSMSADTHKFAYASKGTSVVLYRHKELLHAQYFAYSKWTGGLYVTPTIAGSRPGGLLACAWATLQHIGEAGYLTRVQNILEASQAIADGISKIPGIHVLGTQQPTMVVSFGSDEVDIYRVGDLMSKRGWHLNSLQRPASLHICVTLNTVPVVHELVDALGDVVEAVRREDWTGKKEGMAGIYGMSESLPAGPVDEILNVYTDMMYTP